MENLKTNRRTIWRYGLYGLAFLLSALAVEWSGDGWNFQFMFLVVLLCSAAGAAAAVRDFASSLPWSATAEFVLFYMTGVVFSALAVAPGFFLALVMRGSMLENLAEGLVMEGFFVVGAAVSLMWARSRLQRFGFHGPTTRHRAPLWQPAVISGFGCVAAQGALLVAAQPEIGHFHVFGHPLEVPTLAFVLLLLAPAIVLIICHDSLIRLAARRLFGSNDAVKESKLVAGLRGSGILLGVLVALGISLLMILPYDTVQELLH